MALLKKRSTNNQYSRYVQGGTTTEYSTRLGWWERRIFSRDVSDIDFEITPEYHLRPSKLALDMYGRSEYMFFILQYNTIMDINEEFVTGKVIKLPLPERVAYDIMTKNIGGVSPNEDS